MKSVLISIRPKWCEKIASGKKTIEVRKTAPKEVPFKAYIYMTKKKPYMLTFAGNGKMRVHNGKVIGEFICDRIEMINAKCSDYGIDLFYHDCLTKGCLTERGIEEYFNIPEDKDLRVMKGNCYVWYISDLKIYDKPKELSEFVRKCDYASEIHCRDCLILGDWDSCCGVMCKPLTRPPQSWQYVEEVER